MTDDFESICKDICPHCAAGAPLRHRDDTGEWIHDLSTDITGTFGKRFGQTICMATHFRNKHGGSASG